jgi:hypothetical protein
VQSIPAEKALLSSPRPGVNPAFPAKAVDLSLPAFLQQKNRPQP